MNHWRRKWAQEQSSRRECPTCGSYNIRQDKPRTDAKPWEEWSCDDCDQEWTE